MVNALGQLMLCSACRGSLRELHVHAGQPPHAECQGCGVIWEFPAFGDHWCPDPAAHVVRMDAKEIA